MNNLVSLYLADKSCAWSASTQRSEAYRLSKLVDVLDGDARRLWSHLSEHKPYTRQTIWTRVVDLYDWAIEEGHLSGTNPYRVFRRKHAQLFRNAYTPHTPEMTYEIALSRINEISDASVRKKALELLGAGLRYTESFSIDSEHVVGKGNKTRRVWVPQIDGPDYRGSYQTFRRHLARIGLKPHDLRKLAATQLARSGMGEADLLKAMGWASIATAKAYLVPLKDEEMAKVFRRIQGGETENAQKSIPRKIPEPS